MAHVDCPFLYEQRYGKIEFVPFTMDSCLFAVARTQPKGLIELLIETGYLSERLQCCLEITFEYMQLGPLVENAGDSLQIGPLAVDCLCLGKKRVRH